MKLSKKINKYYKFRESTENIEQEIWKELDLLKFNDEQKRELRYGLEDGLDITIYANPNIVSSVMQQIRKILDNKRYYNEQEIQDQINLLLIES